MAMMARWSCCLATAVAARLPAVRCSASSDAGVAARVGRALRSAGCGDAPFTSRVMNDLDVGQSSLRACERSRVGVIDRRRATADGDSYDETAREPLRHFCLSVECEREPGARQDSRTSSRLSQKSAPTARQISLSCTDAF
jgi:hypothetical protein